MIIDLILPAACLIYVLAATTDVAARIIPDTCSLALLLLGLLRLLLIDGSASALADAATAAGTFTVLVMLCMAGLLGGGDAKLIAASTFFLGFERLADFFSTTALSGGILGPPLFDRSRRPVRPHDASSASVRPRLAPWLETPPQGGAGGGTPARRPKAINPLRRCHRRRRTDLARRPPLIRMPSCFFEFCSSAW